MTLPELIRQLNDPGHHGESEVDFALESFEARFDADAFGTLIAEARFVLEGYPAGRERSLVLTKLEEAELWMTKVGREP